MPPIHDPITFLSTSSEARAQGTEVPAGDTGEAAIGLSRWWLVLELLRHLGYRMRATLA